MSMQKLLSFQAWLFYLLAHRLDNISVKLVLKLRAHHCGRFKLDSPDYYCENCSTMVIDFLDGFYSFIFHNWSILLRLVLSLLN